MTTPISFPQHGLHSTKDPLRTHSAVCLCNHSTSFHSFVLCLLPVLYINLRVLLDVPQLELNWIHWVLPPISLVASSAHRDGQHPTVLTGFQQLVQLECAGRAVPFHSYTKQEMCWTKITTFEVLGEELNILVNCWWRFWSKSDIIYVDGNNDADLSIGVDIDRAVRLNAGEAQLCQNSVQLLVPLACRLLESIQGFAQPTNLGGGTNVESC